MLNPTMSDYEVDRGRAIWNVSIATCSLALLLCIAYVPGFLVAGFTPRAALLIAGGIPGGVLLVRLAAKRDRSAVAAAVCVAWVAVSALGSGAPLLALKGTLGRDLSGLLVLAGFGLWALGRALPERSVPMMSSVVLAGLGCNAAVAIAQVGLSINDGFFALQFGRASGLTPSSVYLGALMAAGAALAGAMTSWRFRWRLLVVSVFGAAVNLSGSRIAAVAGLVTISMLMFGRAGDVARRRRLLLPISFSLGLVVSAILTSVTVRTHTSTGRLDNGTSSGGRLTAWNYGWDAFLERPFFGWGFGRFRAATQGRFSPSFVELQAPNELTQAWFDAHNVIVTLFVAVGLPGLLLVVWFGWEAYRSTSGPFVYATGAIGLTWLLQPSGLTTLPLFMLMLGAAKIDRETFVVEDGIRRRDWPLYGSAALGVICGSWLLIGDLALRRSVDAGDISGLENAARMFPHDAVVADVVAQAWFIEEESDRTLRPTVMKWSQRAVDYEPDRPYFLSRHAGRQLTFGDYLSARSTLDRSLELQEWNIDTWELMFVLAERTNDVELQMLAESRLCQLEPQSSTCTRSLERSP